MKKSKLRICAALLAMVTVFGCASAGMFTTKAEALDYENTYVNTGNQRKDIIGVALTQVGYTEGANNDTKYCDWYGMPNNPWCGFFVTWCARQAEISNSILQRSGVADPGPAYFNIPYYSYDKDGYVPQPGDLFFKKDFGHVGLVYYVEGEYFYTLEGNTSYIGSSEGYFVMSNKRALKDYYYGVPAYEGCDKEHKYVRGHDSSHPHKSFYLCQTCGDKYYTGYTDIMDDCSRCIPCSSCSRSYAGYYMCKIDDSLRIRSGHGMNYSVVGNVPKNTVVYVHAAHPDSGWAYIEWDGLRGHVAWEYLSKYYPAPDAPTVKSEKTDYILGDSFQLTWNKPANTEEFRIRLLRNGTVMTEGKVGKNQSYTMETAQLGDYELQVYACNETGSSQPGVYKFRVRDTYTVTYDARGGAGAPASQTLMLGQVMTLSTKKPTREGYTFLGWTADPEGKFADYLPGDTLLQAKSVKLYAVWRDNNATVSSMKIEKVPGKTSYLVDEPLDTAGMVLRLTYSDGSGHLVSDGYTTGDFSSAEKGTKQVTVYVGELSDTFEVVVMEYLPGDVNMDGKINRDDVKQLLWYITFPDQFPIQVPADFNSDGKTNRDDVKQLLWHITFPDQFPLMG